MELVLLLVAIALMMGGLGAPVLEGVWCLLLFTVIFGAGIGGFSTNGTPEELRYCYIFASVIGVIGFALYRLVYIKRCLGRPLYNRPFHQASGFLVFIVFYLLCYSLSMRWPDFFPMGERLRDYSLISALERNPIRPIEPWASPYPLYYYVWWYRFGAMIGNFLGWHTWDLYHAMVSLPLALLAGVVWSLSLRVFGGSWIYAAGATVLCTLGSNVAGVFYFFSSKEGWNWWGPSRVIKGAINEFPVWSFLLGDAHPHYLNIAVIPLAMLVWVRIADAKFPLIPRIVFPSVLIFITFFWLKGANAWELPMWAAVVCTALFFGLTLQYSEYIRSLAVTGIPFLRNGEESMNDQTLRIGIFEGVTDQKKNPVGRAFRSWAPVIPDLVISVIAVVGAFLIVIIISLLQEQIRAGDAELTWVRAPIMMTRTKEAFLHWGIPLTLVCLFLPLQVRGGLNRFLVYCFEIGTLFSDDAYPLLYFLLFVFCWAVVQRLETGEIEAEKTDAVSYLLTTTFGVASLCLILLPEVVFLNDAYGGDNERMNTIFKVYSFVWTPFHLWAISLVYSAVRKGPLKVLRRVPSIMIFVPLLIFFGLTTVCAMRIAFETGIRSSNPGVRWDREGLSRVEETYPGARAAIRSLRAAEPGLVLEAQDGAYNWSSHITTLSEQPAFLGWRNHVDLLTKDGAEGERREKFTERVYKSTSCDEVSELLGREHIRYVVLGPIERKKYTPQDMSFDCLRLFGEFGQYKVFLGPR